MKKTVWITAFLALWAFTAAAQSLAIGEKAPELKISRWLTEQPSRNGKPVLLEFFYSPSEPSKNRLSALDDLARGYSGRLQVIVIAKEPADKVTPLVKGYVFAVALDEEGKTFDSYGVKFVPFSVLFDGRGRVAWFGNPAKLTEKTMKESLGW